MTDLLPCPFCGSVFELTLDGNDFVHPIVPCFGRNISIISSDTKRIAAWNTRTPTPAPNAGAVKVKPLVWDDDGYGNFRAQSVRGGEGVDRLTEPQVIGDDKVSYEAWGIEGAFDTHEAAQAAVDAEVASEIIDAIEPTPDPRDAVIARLVEALEAAKALHEQGLIFASLDLITSVPKLRDAALAATKEVMK